MNWADYLSIARRRWVLIAVIVLADVMLSGIVYRRANQAAGYQSCLTIYVADVSSPSLIAASSSLDTAAQLLAGETAANFFGDDLLDVAQSRNVATFMVTRLSRTQLPNRDFGALNGAVTGSRLDRTVNLCVTNPSPRTALAAATALGAALTVDRARFIGSRMAKRTYVNVVSPPSTAPAPRSKRALTFLLQLVLGLFVALAAALLWEAFDPRVRDRHDLERTLGLPVLGAPS